MAKFHQSWFLNILAVFIYMWTNLASQEPAYQDILYGGAWKHIALFPSKKYTDVGMVEKRLFHYIRNLELYSVSTVETLECYSMMSLLYSHTDNEPLLLTREYSSSDGSMYPVSIPIPLGSTYHCEVRTILKGKTYQHYITVTKMNDEVSVFVYSHIFFSLEYDNAAFSPSFGKCERTNKQINASGLYVLSSISRTKDHYSSLCSVESKFTEKGAYKKLHCHDAVPKNESDDDSSQFNMQLNVMTYNIWNFNPYFEDEMYKGRINRLLQTITNTSPDILGLQEVRLETLKGGSLGPSQMDHLVPHLKQYQYVFQPAQVFESSLSYGRAEEGVAILSKFPIIYHDYLLLFRNRSNSADGNQRICLHAVVTVPKIGLVHVFNTHYSLSHEAREEASRQILEFMNMHEGPAILMGDLNATPEEKAIRMLVSSTNLIDSWPHLHHEDPGYTFNTLENKLSKRIDYILMRKFPGVELTDVKVVDDKTRSNICSDHRAVQASISFKTCL